MIQRAQIRDLDQIQKIYAYARDFMAKTGNPSQWGADYPSEELLKRDIALGQLFVIEDGGRIHGVFMFAVGIEPTYLQIEGGNWLSDAKYGVIHRIAGDGTIHGVLRQTVEYCERTIHHLRIDTHEDNRVMQHVILKNGFVRCGTIHVADGSPRIAYERL